MKTNPYALKAFQATLWLLMEMYQLEIIGAQKNWNKGKGGLVVQDVVAAISVQN